MDTTNEDKSVHDGLSANEGRQSLISSNAPPSVYRTYSDNAAAVGVKQQQLDKAKLKHRIFAQFIVDEEPSVNTANTAATAGFADNSED